MKSEKKFLALVVSILLIVGLITRFVSLVRVDGSSMTPSLKANSFHIAIANLSISLDLKGEVWFAHVLRARKRQLLRE